MADICADPLLKDRVLIAEPWDIGPGGYQLGNFPAPFLEWNDRARDHIRQFWRGTLPSTLRTGCGSAIYFSSLNALRQRAARAQLIHSGGAAAAGDSTSRDGHSAPQCAVGRLRRRRH